MKLRFLTINIAGVQFNWFEDRRIALINGIKKLSPDFIFLQETTVIPEKGYDQSVDIGTCAGLPNVAFAPYGNTREFESPKLGGISILSRKPFKHVQIRKLPSGRIDKYGARVALMSVVEVDGQEIALATTHLSWRPQEEETRIKQADEVLRLLELSPAPTVLGGDFNSGPLETALRAVQKKYKDVFKEINPTATGITWARDTNSYVKSTWRGNERIDFLFCSSDFKTQSAEVVLNRADPVFPSDHFGVVADLILPPR